MEQESLDVSDSGTIHCIFKNMFLIAFSSQGNDSILGTCIMMKYTQEMREK